MIVPARETTYMMPLVGAQCHRRLIPSLGWAGRRPAQSCVVCLAVLRHLSGADSSSVCLCLIAAQFVLQVAGTSRFRASTGWGSAAARRTDQLPINPTRIPTKRRASGSCLHSTVAYGRHCGFGLRRCILESGEAPPLPRESGLSRMQPVAVSASADSWLRLGEVPGLPRQRSVAL